MFLWDIRLRAGGLEAGFKTLGSSYLASNCISSVSFCKPEGPTRLLIVLKGVSEPYWLYVYDMECICVSIDLSNESRLIVLIMVQHNSSVSSFLCSSEVFCVLLHCFVLFCVLLSPQVLVPSHPTHD